MSEPELTNGYPLRWPAGRPRTLVAQRKPALFRNAGNAMTLTAARKRLRDQIAAMTVRGRPWRVAAQVLSTNIRYTASGARDQNISRRDPDDPGVAFYFDLDGHPHVLACDRWSTVQDNIAAIAAHIDALRGQERWGVADLRQAFAGHAALPAPGQATALPWRAVLGFSGVESIDAAAVDRAYRNAALSAHPDRGGSREAWDRLQAALAAAKRELGA